MDESRRGSPVRAFTRPKMAALIFLGFASGLPFNLIGNGKAFQAWMTASGVDLTAIGLFSLIGLPYSLKFLWAPVLDRYVPPMLGRRRGWLLITQVLLLIGIAAMSLHDPKLGLRALAFNAIMIAIFSASQDIAGDAYRTDVLEDRELGAGAAIWVLGYRIALLLTGSLSFILAERMSWGTVYALLSALMLVGIIATFLAPEPKLKEAPPRSLGEAVALPFQDFFQRVGPGLGIGVLIFIVLYKYSDALAGSMTTPFLLKTGFTQAEVGVVFGGAGLLATIAGSLVAGGTIARIGLNRSLWAFAVFQAMSNLTYYGLALAGRNHSYMVMAIVIENFGVGLVSSALVAYIMSMCNRRFSATQFALLSSLVAASRDILVAPGGKIAESMGWPTFFLITVAAGLPCIALLPFIAPWNADFPTGAVHRSDDTDAGPERIGELGDPGVPSKG
ncbi:MAG TPA: AmpG family muropeptide MFS transporter [Gemmatimonadaceae bacterium]|nr:AmpG family muropeptide MFS transporter [Gemmatimonadaceae bacterium]